MGDPNAVKKQGRQTGEPPGSRKGHRQGVCGSCSNRWLPWWGRSRRLRWRKPTELKRVGDDAMKPRWPCPTTVPWILIVALR